MSASTSAHRKIAIIGAGSVGATIAYACMIRGVGSQIVLHDTNRAEVDAEILDLNHGLQFVPAISIDGSDDIEICRDASVIVITAGAKQKPGQTRMDLADANATILKVLVPELLRVAPDAMLLLVTNPVDVMTYVALKLSGLPRTRVFGSGTVLESSRFRYLIARRLNVSAKDVHAYIVGEHGDSEVPLWSSASVANIPLHEWAVQGHGKLSVFDRTDIFLNVKNAANQVVAGKGATNYASGLSTAKILESLLHDENAILPVSSLVKKFHEIDDVCLSLPCIVGAAGAEPPLPIPLNANEQAGLQNSAAIIRAVIKKLGF